MQSIRIFKLALALLWFVPLPSASGEVSRYVVGIGDQLYVDFPLRGTPSDLQPLGGNSLTLVIVGESVFFRYLATVAPDGFITLPSMSPVRVEGFTLEEIRSELTRRLKNFDLRDPVSVILAHPESQAFVVSGEVNKPGRFVYERPTTLMEAVAMAGGPTDHAQLKEVMVLRSGKSSLKIDMSYARLLREGAPIEMVRPTDSIIIPRRWFTPDNLLILLILSVITTGATVYAATKA